jgi:hypothetical protein
MSRNYAYHVLLFSVIVSLLGVLVRGGLTALIPTNLTRDQADVANRAHLSLEDIALIKVRSPLIGRMTRRTGPTGPTSHWRIWRSLR